MTFDHKACGARIKALRTENHIKQEALAADLGISDTHLRKIESGQRCASIDLFIEIAEYFGVSLDYLILGKEMSRDSVRCGLDAVIGQLEALRKSL